VRAVALIAALAALGIAPAAAHATDVRSVAEYLEVEAAPGQVNNLVLRHDLDRSVVRIEDSAPLGFVSLGGPRCTGLAPNVLECPYPPSGPPSGTTSQFFVELGDRDDRLRIDAPRRSPEVYVAAGLITEVRDGPGNDRASSIPTTTTFVAGPGNDIMSGAARATSSGGNDTITGTVGPDTLDGGAGRDVLRGGIGADLMRGGIGNDRLFGQSGRDRLFGGLGNDFLRGGSARDLLNGGPGFDTQIQG
jgi:RTX calcium-binding nonapeptide repeat (4 copies)